MKKEEIAVLIQLVVASALILVMVAALTGCAGSPRKPINSLGKVTVPSACLETPKAILEPSRGIVDEYIDLVTQYTELAVIYNQCKSNLTGESK